MGEARTGADVAAIKEELMQYLAAHDHRALTVIARLKKEAERTDDTALLGYAYYRYAYFYYFVNGDSKQFHRYIQLAIHHLLACNDREYLACAYNLVAYEAQDHNCYDIAYAYYILALRASEQEEGIAISGLVETSAGRLMTELGHPREGRRQLRNAIRRLLPLTSMHFYHYNMIVNYADEALSSFLLDDIRGVERILPDMEALYDRADQNQKHLSRTFYALPYVYRALLTRDEKSIRESTAALGRLLRTAEEGEPDGLIFEIESLVQRMLSDGYHPAAKQLLDAVRSATNSENLTVALRYASLQIQYAETTGDTRRLKTSLMTLHELQKRQKEERIRMHRYTTGLVEIAGDITQERETAMIEHDRLQMQANTDALTGLPNRNDMNRTLAKLLAHAQQNQETFAVGIMDVDHFKEFNDTYGHQEGDACLKRIGTALREFADHPDVYCARYGGDEFVVCIKGHTGREIKQLSSDIQQAITKKSPRAKDRADFRISFGVCYGKADNRRQLWDFLSAADRTLYRIKKQGGGKHSLFLLR